MAGLSKAQMFLLVIGAIAVISLTWYLTGIPEGIPQRENLTTIAGEYRSVWNPCTELLCPSLTVYAVLAEGVYYYLTVEGSWMLDRPWDGYMPEDGDYVKVTGYVSKKRDIEGSPFFEMEVVSLKPAPKPEYPETKQKVLAVLNNLSYGWEAVYFPGALPITDDIPINETISIYPNEVKNPCPYARCRFKGFAGEKRLALEAGSTVRFRGIIEDYHPAWISRGYKIEVLPASTVPCKEGGIKCEKDLVCYYNWDDYCAKCLEKDRSECVCTTWEGPKPDGEECHYQISGDVLSGIGTCQDGVCVEWE
jgi:hypothetical protein